MLPKYNANNTLLLELIVCSYILGFSNLVTPAPNLQAGN